MITASAITDQQKSKAWYNQSAEEVLSQVGSSANGLSTQEAAQRLAADGPNELKEGKRISPLQIFLSQFKSLLIWILIAAGVISGVLGEMVDAIAILAIVVLNAVIGFYQEFKAEKSIAALKKLTAPEARVLRDGQVTSIPASGIVVGDILALEAGDLVGADARLLEAASLRCIESALTGESTAETKQPATLEQGDVALGDRENMVFMGTSVAAGTAQAVVVATAMKTELGRIAGLIAEAGAEQGTPLQRKLDSFGHILVWAALGIVVLLFGLGLLRGIEPLELFMTSVSLAVAAVPEGLPAVVTVALAVLVFAELLRSFGARSETKPIWRISLFTNINLVIVVAISFGLQVWSQHNATLGRFLRTSTMSFTDCLLLLALGAIPLLILEMVKVVRGGPGGKTKP